MNLLMCGVVAMLVGAVLAGVSIWMCPRMMNAESFIGEYFGGILWAVLVTLGSAGIVFGGVMILAWTDGVQTLQQFI